MLTLTSDQRQQTTTDSPLLSIVREFNTGMSVDAKRFVADQILMCVRDYFVHLPLKVSSLGIDPLRELELAADDIPYMYTDAEFFRRILSIIKRLRDRHTCVRLPAPYTSAVAFLPVAVESVWRGSARPLLVSKVSADLGDSEFHEGVEITHWNGTPIGRYIESLALDTEGANPFARIAIALRSLTTRPLAYGIPPAEDWVTLTYASSKGYRSISIPWRVYFPTPGSPTDFASSALSGGDPTTIGLDRASFVVNAAWRDLFAGARREPDIDVFYRDDPFARVANPLPDNIEYRLARFGTKTFGYIRVFSFDAPDPRRFLEAFSGVLRFMPQTGVILDVRANPGGSIPAGEGLLQLLTSEPIQPARLAFRVTAATQRLASSSPFFNSWRRSLDLRYETGDVFSQGYSLYDPAMGAGLEGSYRGPVVLIVDALSYSTTDFLAAGFQDNQLGRILGVDPVTGAGGANVWTHSQIYDVVRETPSQGLSPLPADINFNLALRRSIRVGRNDGLPLEGLGVFSDEIHRTTLRDVVGHNEDLVARAAFILSSA